MTTSTPRDFDSLMEAFLEEGPAQLSDRLGQRIAGEVHRTRQGNPWRLPTFGRLTLPGVAMALLLAIGLAVAIGSLLRQVGTTPSPTAAPSFVDGGAATGFLPSGQQYHATAFAFRFSFVLPAEPSGSWRADSLGDSHSFRIDPEGGAVTFHDGVGLPADLCHPQSGLLDSVPATPQEVADWLGATPGLTLSAPTDFGVDGRRAQSWDIYLSPSCYIGDAAPFPGPSVWFQGNEHHRVYAIPTPSGVMLAFTWPSGYRGAGEDTLPAVNSWTDELLGSIRFE